MIFLIITLKTLRFLVAFCAHLEPSWAAVSYGNSN